MNIDNCNFYPTLETNEDNFNNDDVLHRSYSKLQKHTKRNKEHHSADPLYNKKFKIDDKITPVAIGIVMVHITFNSYNFTKALNIKAPDLSQAIKELEGCFRKLKCDLDEDAKECSISLNTQSSTDATNYDSDMTQQRTKRDEYHRKKGDGDEINECNKICESSYEINERREVSESYEISEIQEVSEKQEVSERHEMQLPENYNKFKFPILDQIKSTKARLSSSTSSSSVRASSSVTNNRDSTTSISTRSESSEDFAFARKSDCILVPDSSDNSMDKGEPTFIENSDDEEDVTKIYARWKTEKYFYSAVVKGNLFKTELQVYFDDNSTETIKRTDILFREVLPIGTEIMVDLGNSGSFVRNFVIVDYADINKFKRKPQRGYKVMSQTTNEEHTVSRDCVSAHIDAVRKLLPFDVSVDQSTSDYHNMSSSNISVENIVSGKRNIKPKRFSQFVSPDFNRIKRCNSPSLLTLSTSPIRQRSTPQKRRNVLTNKSNLTSLNSIEPVKMFTNWYFMVTQENCQADPGTISKEYVEESIKGLDGNIVEVPSEGLVHSQRAGVSHLVLIVLGQSYRTIKFMTALAIGNIPIIRANWLEECIRTVSIVPYESFLVPRGTDDENKEILQGTGDKLCLFGNTKICIVTDRVLNFGSQWRGVLEMCGADVSVLDTSDFSPEICSSNCDWVVIERDGVTRNCLNYLKERNLEVVRIEYVIDSLIQNRVLDRDRYRE